MVQWTTNLQETIDEKQQMLVCIDDDEINSPTERQVYQY